MSSTRHTTRHHLNRQRRLAAVRTPARTPVRETARTPEQDIAPERESPSERERPSERAKSPERKKPAPREPWNRTPVRISRLRGPRPVTARRVPRPLAALCLLTLLLGGFAGWATARAQGLRDEAALRNSALLDPARTSEVKGQAEKAVNALFSYDQADPAAAKAAADRLLTGNAVAQHRTLLAPVLKQAEQQKTVVTTTVTDSAVERIDGDRARVLVFADQSSTGTVAKAKTDANYAGAMLAVDLVEKDGTWRVSAIDTFGT
ncbi:hypothetical protein ACIBI4_29715 [Streptomyces sp. NPDC050418]|uniref:hypothetical protein n=1 Tax=Streptomyces sp. NPDC050418 TaxID=3365612 RepID=UPI0037B0420C